MNYRYLYRAKRTDNGEWVEGYLFDDGFENGRMFVGGLVIEEYHGIACDDWIITGINFYEVDPLTICQCTGLKDKNGKLIWENDILNRGNLVVTWREELASYCLTKKGWMYQHFFGEAVDACDCEVIGNIFDNPELLEVGHE